MNSDPDLFSIQGRNAVVTGASSGLGRAIAEIFAQEGANVVLLARRGELLSKVSDGISLQGGQSAFVAADLNDRESLPSVREEIRDCFGEPQIVVNAAGVNLREPAGDVSWESWNRTIQLNLSIPFFFSRMFVEHMKASEWGRIINIASLQSMRAFPNGIAYGASKGGIAQLTRAMAEAWSGSGIGCNAISPGFFPTELTAPLLEDPDAASALASRTAVGRNGRMSDLHGPILFLASRASDYVTGQLLFVDGGFTAK